MNGIPQAYPNGTRLVVRDKVVVVTDHAPHAEDWRYTGHPVDLGGQELHFSHHEAHPVPPSGLASSARSVLDAAGIDSAQFAVEHRKAAIEHEQETVIEALAAWAHGHLSDGDLRMSFIIYKEQTAS